MGGHGKGILAVFFSYANRFIIPACNRNAVKLIAVVHAVGCNCDFCTGDGGCAVCFQVSMLGRLYCDCVGTSAATISASTAAAGYYRRDGLRGFRVIGNGVKGKLIGENVKQTVRHVGVESPVVERVAGGSLRKSVQAAGGSVMVTVNAHIGLVAQRERNDDFQHVQRRFQGTPAPLHTRVVLFDERDIERKEHKAFLRF